MALRLFGYGLVVIALVLTAGVLYMNSPRSDIPLLFSPIQVLGSTWNAYKLEYLEPGTARALDKQRENITTSEGQSYTMLRAVWTGDKQTFDTAWQWTKDNLNRPNDWLFSWLFGQRSDGTWGVLMERGGETTASDADQDIALALIFAYARWQDPAYLGDARVIVRDLWEEEVIIIAGTPYLAANNYEKNSSESTAIINPSYLAPYAYRVFSIIDPEHDWNALVASSYDLIGRSMDHPLDTETSASLPPDWVRINKQTGALTAAGGSLTSNFGFDALRTPWRLALDYQWYGDERAKELLTRMQFLSDEWERNGALASTYTHAGNIVFAQETPAMYGGTIGYFIVADPARAHEVYEQKLQYLFNPNDNTWRETLSYYDDNWAWFGFGLYHNLLPNLSANLPPEAYQI